MSSDVFLSVPSDLAELIIAQANQAGKTVAETLRSAIQVESPQPKTTMEDWSDAAVLAAANLQMPAGQDARHSALLQLKQIRELTSDETAELMNLQEVYNAGNLHKARGMAEAHRRGLPSTI
jgi:hypothetical protein